MVNNVYTRLKSRIRRRMRLWSRRKSSLLRRLLPLVILALLLWLMLHGNALKVMHEPRTIYLKNQPDYAPPTSRACRVEICNPSGKCSIWNPGSYQWKDLVDQSLYRDVASVDVGFGCQATLKVDQGVDQTELITISNEKVVCKNDLIGLDTLCWNTIELTVEANLYTAGTQIRDAMNRPDTSSQELVLIWESQTPTRYDKEDITLVSQFSVNRLEIFERVLDAWNGPVSIAIYLTHRDDIETFINYFKDVKKRELYAGCTVTIVKPDYTSNLHLRYPINHLRNLAITASTSDYIYVIDADFVPSRKLYHHSRSKLLPHLRKSRFLAMIVPCLAVTESNLDDIAIETTSDIRSLFRSNKAYITDPRAGHGPTFTRQIALAHNLKLGDYYEVCYESQWEPYYIVHKSAPLYDARFRNQGGDKQSHVLMLNALGYRFVVARGIFMVHTDHSAMVWPGGGLEKAQKEEREWTYFDGFMREMEKLFGKNVRWPRGCSAKTIGWQEQRRDILGLAAGSALLLYMSVMQGASMAEDTVVVDRSKDIASLYSRLQLSLDGPSSPNASGFSSRQSLSPTNSSPSSPFFHHAPVSCACAHAFSSQECVQCTLCGSAFENLKEYHMERQERQTSLREHRLQVRELTTQTVRHNLKLEKLRRSLECLQNEITGRTADTQSLVSDRNQLIEKLAEEQARLAQIQKDKVDIEHELAELSQNLLEEANGMVAIEQKERQELERQSSQVRLQLESVQEALLTEQQQLTEIREKMMKSTETEKVESFDPENHIDDMIMGEFKDFVATCPSIPIKKLHNIQFLRNCLVEDIEPCLRFPPNARMSSKKLVDAMAANSCFIEVMPTGFSEEQHAQRLTTDQPLRISASRSMIWEMITGNETTATSCMACGRTATLTHRFRISFFDDWACIDRYCRDRLITVCAFYQFVRNIRHGRYRGRSIPDLYQESVQLRLQMILARNGMLTDAMSLPDIPKLNDQSGPTSTNTSFSASTDIDTDESVGAESPKITNEPSSE